MKVFIALRDEAGTMLGRYRYKQLGSFAASVVDIGSHIKDRILEVTHSGVSDTAHSALYSAVKLLLWRYQPAATDSVNEYDVTKAAFYMCGALYQLELEIVQDEQANGTVNAPNTEQPKPASTSAQAALERAHELLAERGKKYDASGQERSMAHIVDAFNAVYWKREPMTVQQGWDFMLLLKMVRGASVLHADSAEDMVSYAALRAECVLEQLENKAMVNNAE